MRYQSQQENRKRTTALNGTGLATAQYTRNGIWKFLEHTKFQENIFAENIRFAVSNAQKVYCLLLVTIIHLFVVCRAVQTMQNRIECRHIQCDPFEFPRAAAAAASKDAVTIISVSLQLCQM